MKNKITAPFSCLHSAKTLLCGAAVASLLGLSPVLGSPEAVAQPSMEQMFNSSGTNEALSADRRQAVIDGVIQQMRAGYAVEAMGEKMAQAIEKKRDAGGYNKVTRVIDLAAELTADLKAVSQDKHLKVIYRGAAMRPMGPPPPPKPGEKVADVIAGNPVRSNFEYHEARWLPGNVGYLKVSSFAAPAALSETARSSAMAFLGNTEALIIDLRDNQGGAADNPLRLMSYFFEKPTLVGTTHWRASGRVDEVWTQDLGGFAYGETKPVYILINKVTFSSGESMAYNMQGLGRAKTVGETSAGGAHPTLMSFVDEQFAILLPSAYGLNAKTKANWERVGVKPDIAAPAAKALDAAYAAALKDLISKAESPERAASLQEALKKIGEKK